MDFDLPTDFDLIVLGTGITESIVAAAASRIGKRVLHIDSNNYYGGLWASFNLDSLNKLAEPKTALPEVDTSKYLNAGDQLFSLNNPVFNVSGYSQKWHVPEKVEEPSDEAGIDTNSKQLFNSQEKLLQHSRKFNIDIAPKLHFARGDFVELLISSNIARYAEFRSVSRVLTWVNDQLEIVPCSRSDVFSSTKVSVIEKRILMKLMTSCIEGGEAEFTGYENKTFLCYLKDRNLTDNLIHFVLYALSNSNELTPCLEGVENTKRFLTSLGRFGKTPFLYSMYGTGEITQAFCRLSAVFGGIYALSQSLHGIIFDTQSTFKGIICGSQRINAENLVIGAEYLPHSLITTVPTDFISRAIFITDRSILEDEREHLTLIQFPPENGKNSCVVIETGSLTGTSPKNLYIVHMFTKKQVNAEEDLKHCSQKLFGEGDGRPNILWSLFYCVPDASDLHTSFNLYKNLFACPGPDLDLDYDQSIKQAKRIFDKMYPNTEFLPRAPDPEEIVIEGEDTELGEVAQGVEGMQIDKCDEAMSVDAGLDKGDAV